MSTPPISQLPSRRFLVDQNLPLDLVAALQAEGYIAEHTQKIGLGARSDREVFRYACTAGAALITHDHDFAYDRDQFPPPHPGIILVELPQRWSVVDLIQRITMALRGLHNQALDDRVVIVEPSLVTVRRV